VTDVSQNHTWDVKSIMDHSRLILSVEVFLTKTRRTDFPGFKLLLILTSDYYLPFLDGCYGPYFKNGPLLLEFPKEYSHPLSFQY
jgi:hypothetical protein